MWFGVHFAPMAETMGVHELGRMVEDAGFESLFLPEHIYLSAYGASVYPCGWQMHEWQSPITIRRSVTAR